MLSAGISCCSSRLLLVSNDALSEDSSVLSAGCDGKWQPAKWTRSCSRLQRGQRRRPVLGAPRGAGVPGGGGSRAWHQRRGCTGVRKELPKEYAEFIVRCQIDSMYSKCRGCTGVQVDLNVSIIRQAIVSLPLGDYCHLHFCLRKPGLLPSWHLINLLSAVLQTPPAAKGGGSPTQEQLRPLELSVNPEPPAAPAGAGPVHMGVCLPLWMPTSMLQAQCEECAEMTLCLCDMRSGAGGTPAAALRHTARTAATAAPGGRDGRPSAGASRGLPSIRCGIQTPCVASCRPCRRRLLFHQCLC